MALRASEWLLDANPSSAAPRVFQLAFIFIAVLGAVGLFDLVSLPRDAGSQVSGHGGKR
jgi:hypothetical protein